MTAVPHFSQALPSDSVEHKLITDLGGRLAASRETLNRNDAYFRGEHPLAFMQPLIKEKLDDRILPMMANFCEFIVETYEARLDVEGFDYPAPKDGPSPEDLWEVWRASDMDEGASMAHTDALALGRSYMVVGDGDSSDDPPLITVESALQMTDIRDARTRRVKSAGKFWTEPGDRPSQDQLWSAIWTPDRDATYRRTGAGWVLDWEDVHERGAVSVEPLVCKPRTLDKNGRSVFESLLPISDGLNKTLSDMMTSMEFHAIPRRWATGLSERDFKDDNGNDLSVFKLMADQVWAVSSEEAKFGQFDEADLKNFHDSAKLLIKMIGMLVALPGHTTAFDTVNPPSADSMRSAENDFVKREERMQTSFGGGHQNVQRHVLHRMAGKRLPEARLMETQWRDAGTPTVAQKADAVVKKFQARIIPLEQARIDLGYSPEQRNRMRGYDEQDRNGTYSAIMRNMTDEGALDGADGSSGAEDSRGAVEQV